MRTVKRCVGLLLLLGGLFAFLAPELYTLYFNSVNQRTISDFQEEHGFPENITEEPNEKHDEDPVYRQFLRYNQNIYETRQADLTDAWAYEQTEFGLELEDDLFGYIEIPAMDVKLPLYLGATEEHLAAGAAVLGQTSVPIGGRNTNCVIAGHRGFRGAPYFREIEKLSVGDAVSVTNPWETLTYTVTQIVVIAPDDLDAVLIQEGRDMVTLVTCHPYRGNGRYRYVVYCERKTSQTPPDMADVEENADNSTGETQIESSEQLIVQESAFRIICAAVITGLLIRIILTRKCRFCGGCDD